MFNSEVPVLTPEENHSSLVSIWTSSRWLQLFECKHPDYSLFTKWYIWQIYISSN